MMKREIKIGGKMIGDGHPTYIVGEIGINHNGDIEIAKQLIDVAKWAGVDAVKFQKRTPELCVPEEQKTKMRETPWGYISYLDYRYKVEFGKDEYQEIDAYAKEKGMTWFASPWDEKSVDFLEDFAPVCYKVASASLTDKVLLERIKETGRPVIMSTGMSTVEEIKDAVKFMGTDNLMITHTTSAYPCEPEELNLRMIKTLQEMFPVPVGYSGHEVGLVPSAVAVALGASLVERHITLDRALWGSDQAASVEPGGLNRLVKYIRATEVSLGDGEKHIYESELSSLSKLRRTNWQGN
ncbi:MAG: N-acetylneuraminate synthase family protein [Anaerolineales bacterium]